MRLILCRAVLVLSLAAACSRGAETAADDPAQLAQKVHDIFEAKCIDCHGPELPRPKGKFGYVLDLKRVAGNSEYIVRGKPAKSDLYNMVEDDEMPGEDANVPPLTAQEKNTVKRWIEIGAPGDLPGKKGGAGELAKVVSARPPESLGRHLLRWAGKLHPVTTHFPVALMLIAVLAEGIGLITRRESWTHTVRFLIIVAAIGGVATVVSGWVNAYFSSYNKAMWGLLWWHRWFGTGTAIWALVCAGASFYGDGEESARRRWHFRVALFVGAGLVGITGFLGSALIYGLDHYAW